MLYNILYQSHGGKFMPRTTLDPKIRKTIGNNIRLFLTENGMTQQDLAYVVDVALNTIQNIVSGKTSIELSTLIKIADHFETTLDTLVRKKTN